MTYVPSTSLRMYLSSTVGVLFLAAAAAWEAAAAAAAASSFFALSFLPPNRGILEGLRLCVVVRKTRPGSQTTEARARYVYVRSSPFNYSLGACRWLGSPPDASSVRRTNVYVS